MEKWTLPTASLQLRIILILFHFIEKAPTELANLGKISLSAIRNAYAVGLGANIKGDAADVLEALPTDAIGIGPYLCIVDEYAAIVTPGFEVVLTQDAASVLPLLWPHRTTPVFWKLTRKERNRWWQIRP